MNESSVTDLISSSVHREPFRNNLPSQYRTQRTFFLSLEGEEFSLFCDRKFLFRYRFLTSLYQFLGSKQLVKRSFLLRMSNLFSYSISGSDPVFLTLDLYEHHKVRDYLCIIISVLFHNRVLVE